MHQLQLGQLLVNLRQLLIGILDFLGLGGDSGLGLQVRIALGGNLATGFVPDLRGLAQPLLPLWPGRCGLPLKSLVLLSPCRGLWCRVGRSFCKSLP